MIEHVLGIHAELQALGLGQLDRFRQACIKAPAARSFDRTLAKRSPCSRQRILKENLSGLDVGDSAETAESRQVGRDGQTLWIFDLLDRITREIATGGTTCKFNAAGMHIKRPNDIGRSVG